MTSDIPQRFYLFLRIAIGLSMGILGCTLAWAQSPPASDAPPLQVAPTVPDVQQVVVPDLSDHPAPRAPRLDKAPESAKGDNDTNTVGDPADDPNAALQSPAEVAPLTDDEIKLLNGDRGWPAGSLRKQLDRDSTLVPYGKGAIFVPAMTNGLDEPPITIWRGNEKITDSTTGTRVSVTPGEYFVEIGSGSVETRFGRTVVVHELKTTVVPVMWSGLTVHVVDPQLNSLRLPYEVIRMSDREYIGAGFGADEQQGETVATWILQPGLYKIVRVGGTYRDRQDFSTVRLMPGMHTQYLLVLDPDTSDFKGAGEARPEELFHPDQGFWASLILGGDMSLNARQSVVGFPDGNGYAINAFLDTKLNAQILSNPLLVRLQIEEGQTRLPTQAFQKIQDIVQLDLLYIYRYKPWAGPYVRAHGVTNLFGSTVLLNPPAMVTVRDASNGEITIKDNVHVVKLTPPFGQIAVREGGGMNFRVLKTLFGEINLRSGLGLQHTLNRDILQQVSPNVYVKLASGNAFGVEATLTAIGRITRWVVLNVVVDSLIPFDRHQRVNLDVEGTLALKLTQFAAVNYVLKYKTGPLYPKALFEQDVLLRFSLELL